jgi:APA family basic amino acid/polyamine antiporter
MDDSADRSRRPLAGPASFTQLRGNVGPAQYFALGFGCIVGSGWLIIAGNWLAAAGPGGAALGFLLGGAVIVIVGSCYAELSARIPEAGSEFVYARRVFGSRVAFIVGWFLLLFFVATSIFEGLALGSIIQVIMPSLATPTLYVALGEPLSRNAVVMGVVAALMIAIANYRGIAVAARLQSILTYGFLIVALLLLAALQVHGTRSNLIPLFGSTAGKPWYVGTLWIFATCGFLMNGFQAIPHAIEEKSQHVTAKAIAALILASIVASICFYWLVVISVGSSMPWGEIATKRMAAASAIRTLPYGGVLSTVLLYAGAASLLKTWNAMVLMGSRVLMAMARAGLAPGALGAVHPRFKSPANAVKLIATLNILGLFMGQKAIVPIVNMCAMTLTLNFAMCCATVMLLRRRHGRAGVPFTVPGGYKVIWVGTLGAVAMVLSAFVSPWLQSAGKVPIEWILLFAWSLIGLVVWLTQVDAGHRLTDGKQQA